MKCWNLLLKYLKVLIWPCILLFFMWKYSPQASTLINNIVAAKKIKIGSFEIELAEQAANLDTILKEKEAKEVSIEDTYEVLKTVKEFQNAVQLGKYSELEKYFSKSYPNRDKNIKGWEDLSKKDISIIVKDIKQYGTQIKASIVIAVKGDKWEETTVFIKEDERWKFLR